MERAAWLRRRYGAEIEWRPFDLHPEYPPEGISRDDLALRYGPGIEEHTRQLIGGAGFEYRRPARVPRGLKALELGELARAEGRHDEVHPRLFHAYWSEGQDIGDIDVLLRIAAEAGLDPERARQALAADTYAGAVEASTREAVGVGVNGVPAWVVDDRLLIPGAQPHEVFDQVLEQLGYRAAAA